MPQPSDAFAGNCTPLRYASPAYPASLHSQSRSRFDNSSTDTAYNGSGGLIDEFHGHQSNTRNSSSLVQQQPPAPARQPLSARLLSAVSNAQPAAVALTRKGSILHSRAKSLAAFVPKLNTVVAPAPERKESSPSKLLPDFFHGESAPVRLGPPVSPTKEKEETEFIMEYRPQFTERPAGGPRRKVTAESKSNIAPATQVRPAGWFGRRSTAQIAPASAANNLDEFLNMNVNTCLFPDGPADPMNPAAFNDLLLNATSILQRMLTAYKEKVDFITSMRPELDAQKEEVEEAETRSAHLKIQLQDMSRRAQEQETMLKEATQQLTDERMRSHELGERLSVRVVPSPSDSAEDEHGAPRRRKRTSAGSASDSGFESDADAESLFSRASSHLDAPISPPSISLTPTPERDTWTLSQPKKNVLRPVAGAVQGGKRIGSEGAAWATVEVMRDENRELKRQMAEMQGSLQECIDFVGGVRLV